MPRYSRIPAILRTKARTNREVVVPNTPRLWNAKRRIKYSRGLSPEQLRQYRADPSTVDLEEHVSKDVLAFLKANIRRTETDQYGETHEIVPENELKPSDVTALLRNPAGYFSRPHRVPLNQRKQVWFPDYTVGLVRTPNKSPYYATFNVPLKFNKFDLKSYLKQLYNVDTVDIRTYLFQRGRRNKVARSGKEGAIGRFYRPQPLKRMTVQLVEAFNYPKELENFDDYDKEEFWRAAKAARDHNARQSEEQLGMVFKPYQDHRVAVAQQARDVLAGKQTWKPTWTQLDADTKVLKGIADVMPKVPEVPKIAAPKIAAPPSRPKKGNKKGKKVVPRLEGRKAPLLEAGKVPLEGVPVRVKARREEVTV